MVNSKTYKTYVKEFSDIGNRVSQESLDQVLGFLIDFPKESRIFVCGNGGSASTAEHFSADFSTGSNRRGRGFDGGATRQLVDHPIHVETEFGAYGLVEDIHLSLVHYLVERFRSTNSR